MKRTRVRLAAAAAFKDWADGTEYLWGAKPSLVKGSLAIEADCSGALTRWVALAGVRKLVRGDREVWVRDWHGSVNQKDWCVPLEVTDSVAYALGPKGVGLFLFMYPKGTRPGHVALSLGDGMTIECRARRGVDLVGAATNRRRKWDVAMKLPELFTEVG